MKELFIKDGHTEQAWEELNEGIKKLFDYAAKFHHEEERGGSRKLLPEIKTSKEDAYLIFSLSLTIINSIARKIKRHSESK